MSGLSTALAQSPSAVRLHLCVSLLHLTTGPQAPFTIPDAALTMCRCCCEHFTNVPTLNPHNTTRREVLGLSLVHRRGN